MMTYTDSVPPVTCPSLSTRMALIVGRWSVCVCVRVHVRVSAQYQQEALKFLYLSVLSE